MPIIATVVILVAAVAVAGGLFLARGASPLQQVALEPVAFSGANPFTEPVGTDAPKVTAVSGSGGEFAGDTPGLYGDTGDTPSCDAQKLETALQADPAKTAAWAEALGLTAADVPAYIATLSPVVLRADTAVTEHGYAGGTFSPYPAVLQSGTAVFINSYGEPKVKCYSGNPLTKPTTTQQQVGYTGAQWAGFTPQQVTVVTRPATVVKQYTVINVRSGSQSSKPGKGPGPDDQRGFCDKNPNAEKCTKGGGPNPGGVLGPAPQAGCTPSGNRWVCPADFDPAKKPAPNCTQVGTTWSCPVTDPNTPPAPNCSKAGAAAPVAWTCPPPLDPAKPPAAGCTAQGGMWACPFPPDPDVLVGGKCTKSVVVTGAGSAGSQSCPQPFDPNFPPAPDCNSRGETVPVWECPITGGLAQKPPGPGCVASGAIWVNCETPFNAAMPPAPGCLAQDFRWTCPVGVGKPPAENCTKGDTGWMCPPALDPNAKPPAPNCTSVNGTWSCPVADATKPPAPNCTKTAQGWSCPPPTPAEGCVLMDKGFVCPPVNMPAGKAKEGTALTPEQVTQVCTAAQGGCTDGKPTAEQQCAALPATCTDGKPNAPAGGTPAAPDQGRALTAEQIAQICAVEGGCTDGQPNVEQLCAMFPATCGGGKAPPAGGNQLAGDDMVMPEEMMVGQGMGEQGNPCMFMTETCPAGTPGVGEAGTPAGTDAGAGAPAGAPPPDPNAGAGAPLPCPGPGAPPDPARPECPVAVDPPAPAAPPADPGAGTGNPGGDTGGGPAGGDTGGQGTGDQGTGDQGTGAQGTGAQDTGGQGTADGTGDGGG